MKIVTWNVNGIRAIFKKDFESQIAKLDPDLLCLQETKAEAALTEDLLQSLGNYTVHAREAERKGYSGTAIASKIPPGNISHPQEGELAKEGRIQCADFGEFYLVNVYVPNSGNGLKRLDYREQWDTGFLKYLKGLKEEKPLILCGDLNVAHRAIDLKNDKSNYNKTAGYTQVEIDGMDRMQEAGLVDVFRKFYPETEAYSYWSYRFNARQKNIGWRIDYFLISEALLPRVKAITIHKELEGSDHCPVVLELE